MSAPAFSPLCAFFNAHGPVLYSASGNGILPQTAGIHFVFPADDAYIPGRVVWAFVQAVRLWDL
jgi:hypothetical protein